MTGGIRLAATLRQATAFLAAAAAVAMTATAAMAQEAARPTKEELDAITERGRMLYEYDQAAWHASDAVQTANPSTVAGQRYIGKKENGRWRVVFGKLNEEPGLTSGVSLLLEVL